MLIIFNKSGSEFQVDFQYDSFSQGDTNTHIINVIVDDDSFSNYDYNGYIQFLRDGEKEPSPKLIMATKTINHNDKKYRGYSFVMESEWYTAVAGILKATIEIKKFSNGTMQSNKAYGVINIPVQPSVSAQSEVVTAITDEEYTALVQLINSKLNVDDYDIEKVWFDVEEDFADDITYQVENDVTMRKIFFATIGDEIDRYEAIGLVEQRNQELWCNIWSARGLNRYIRKNGYVEKVSVEVDDVSVGKLLVQNKAEVPYPTQSADAVNLQYVQDNYNNKNDISNTLLNYLLKSDLTRNKIVDLVGKATQQLDGLMSKEDKKNLDTLVAMMTNENSSFVDTLSEVLKIFKNYPEGQNLLEILATKADKSDLENIDFNNIKNIPDNVTFAVRSEVSADTNNTAKEFEIGGKKWKLGDTLYRHDLKVDFQNDTYYMTGYKRIYTTSKNEITKEEVVNYLNSLDLPSFQTTTINFDFCGSIFVSIRYHNYNSLSGSIDCRTLEFENSMTNVTGSIASIRFTGFTFENYVADVVDVVTEVTNGIYL